MAITQGTPLVGATGIRRWQSRRGHRWLAQLASSDGNHAGDTAGWRDWHPAGGKSARRWQSRSGHGWLAQLHPADGKSVRWALDAGCVVAGPALTGPVMTGPYQGRIGARRMVAMQD
jgi:hypothetical protein